MFKLIKILSILLMGIFLFSCSDDTIKTINVQEEVATNEVATNEVAINEETTIEETVVQEESVIVEETIVDEIELELNQLINTIKALKDSSDVIKVFKDFINQSELEIVHVYYADINGLHMEPYSELPEDYDPTKRPFYINALKDGINIPEAYNDFMTNRMIQTISKPIYVKSEIIGVIGVDVYLEPVVMPKIMPDDFNIVFTYGVKQANQHDGINSKDNTIQKDLVLNGLAVTDIDIKTSLINEMYQILRAVNVVSYPSVYNPDYKDHPEKNTEKIVTPSMVYDLAIAFDDISYKLYWHNGNASEAVKAVELENAFNKLVNLIIETDEYKNFEDGVGAYE